MKFFAALQLHRCERAVVLMLLQAIWCLQMQMHVTQCAMHDLCQRALIASAFRHAIEIPNLELHLPANHPGWAEAGSSEKGTP